MDNRFIAQLRAEAKNAPVHCVKTSKGKFFMKGCIGEMF